MLATSPIGFLVTASGELDTTGGTLRFASGLQGVAQTALVRARNIRGEWFLDRESGRPLYPNKVVSTADALLGSKPFDAVKAEATFRSAFESIPGVIAVLLLQQTFDRRTRRLRSRWQLRTQFGDTPVQESET